MDGERGEEWWALLPPGVRELPADLGAVLVFIVAVNAAVFVPVINTTPLRVVLGLPFVLFVPGYVFIAALFPEAGASPVDEMGVAASEAEDAQASGVGDALGGGGRRGIDGIERVALSFGLSIAIVPLLGLVLNFTPWGIRLVPIMVATSGFSVCAIWVAARRRWALPVDERFQVPYRSWVDAGRAELFEPESRTDAVLNVVLVLSIVVAVSSVAYAVAVPKQGESFTEFYLLTEDESGELVAAEYPTEFTAGEGQEVVIGIGNQEHESASYTVVVELQRVEVVTAQQERTASATASVNATTVRVIETEELRRFQTEIGHNETWERPCTVRPTLVGENMRLVFLLYRDSPPDNPDIETAYRERHLWINVSQG